MFKKIFLFSTILKNDLFINKKHTFLKNNKIYSLILNILWDNGLILSYKLYKKKLKILLKYINFKSVISNIKPILKSNKILFFSLKQIFKLNQNFIYIFLTNYGFKSSLNCKNLNIGGKLILIII